MINYISKINWLAVLFSLFFYSFLVANTFNIAINPNIPHPMPYGLLVGGFHLVGILVSCSIMQAMRKK